MKTKSTDNPKQKLRITFQFPLPPEEERPPKDEVIMYPEAVMLAGRKLPKRDYLDLPEHALLAYLVKETYGEYQLQLERSLAELRVEARAFFEPGVGGKTLVRAYTKPRIARALKKFERLGIISIEASR